VGTVEVDAKANVVVTGVFATGRVGRPLVWSIIDTAQTPDWQPILEAA
jgi:IMP dehydrogenase/GMP reductase